jgi:DMSO reductase anchor subunit
MVMSTMHLGKPQYFYRAMNNLRHSWVSREIATMGTFYGLLGAYAVVMVFPSLTAWSTVLSRFGPLLLGWGAAMVGPIGLYCMVRCYRIKARPYWDHWHTGGAFFSSALILSSTVIGLVFGFAEWTAGRSFAPWLNLLAWPLLAGCVLQGVAWAAHARYLERRGEEAAVSRQLMLWMWGKTYAARSASFVLLTSSALAFAVFTPDGGWALAAWGATLALALMHEIIGRALFYLVVVPTSNPGAFFWGNKVFEAHARRTGLAAMPQVGVVPESY